MGRSPCCVKNEVNRGSWSAQEDKILESYIKAHGEGKWRDLPKKAGLKRCGKSCRLRWLNYLRPDIKRGNISKDEEELIIKLHRLLGNRWSLIAGRLPGRTDNEIKNYWNSNLSKRLGEQKQQSHTNKPQKPKAKPTSHTKKSPIESSPPVIRAKASKCTKVVIPKQASIDSVELGTKLVNSYDYSDDEENKMSLVRGGTGNQSSSTEDFSDLLIDYGIGDLLITNLLAGPPCSSDKNNTAGQRDQNGQSNNNNNNNRSAGCVDLAVHFGDEANCRLDDLVISEAIPENWNVGEFFQPNEAEMDLSWLLNLE